MVIQSVWKESVSARATRLHLPVEHFIGYRMDCDICYRPFRTFRSYERRCGACR